MAEHILRKQYRTHYGLDLKSNDLTRAVEFSSGMKNAQYRPSGSPEKRKGYKASGASAGGYGLWTYNRANPDTGVSEPELLTIDQNLYRYENVTLAVSYAGAAQSTLFSLYLDTVTSQFRCLIVEGTTTQLDYALGKGYDEASPVTITTLAAQINALTGYTATITGDGSVPAAFLNIIRAKDLVSAAISLTAKVPVTVNSTVTNPLSAYYAERGGDDFENVSAIQVQNVMYFGSGHSETMKYDGQTFYRAGLPTPASTFASALGGAGAVTGTNYVHRIQYIQEDAAGNLVEGNLASSAALNPVAQQFTLTIPNVQAGTGFNTNCAKVNGNQLGVTTITVTVGHTIKVGDTAFFKDQLSGLNVTRSVTAVTATSITISGAAVDVNNTQPISNNLRIAIWRSVSSAITPTLFYLVDEVPNDSFTATQSYTDNKTDAQLGEILINPVTDRSPPPKGKYVAQWNGILGVAGNLENPDILYYSDVDGPEYFPNNTNQLLIESSEGDKIVGIAQSNEVFLVLKERTMAVISGDIGTNQVRVEIKSRNTGAASHASMADINGVMVWLSQQGPRSSAGGSNPRPLGSALDEPESTNIASRIDPEFETDGLDEIARLQLKRSIGFNDRVGQKYILFVPAESEQGGTKYANTNTRVFVYDYTRDAWLEWSNFNAFSGMALLGTEFYFQERRQSTFLGSVVSILYRRNDLNDAYDYADSTECVGGSTDGWQYSSQWEALGEPAVLKKYLKLRLYGLEEVDNNIFTVTIDQEVNYQKGVVKMQKALSLFGSGYGDSPYSDAPYGDPAEVSVTHTLYRDRVRSTRFIFRNSNIHENVVLSGWEIECAAPFRPAFKS